jgi:hypothetical protein
MPSIDRRAMLTGLATTPATISLSVAAQAIPDPALRAIAAWKPVRAKWDAALEAAGVAGDAACRRAGPRPKISFRGETEDGVGEFFVRRFFDKFTPLADPEVEAARRAALHASRDYSARKAEAGEIERVAQLQAIAQDWCNREAEALTTALTTTPTTLAGLHAVIRLMADEPDTLGECTDAAAASLAAAAAALLPDSLA